YEVTKMFFGGGAASLVMTLLLFSVFPVYDLDFTGAVIVGFVEEVGKLAIIAYFIRKLNPKYILNCLLICATIGAGFSAFESAGYEYSFCLKFGHNAIMSTIFTRAWMAIDTHTVWAAIDGVALVYVKGAEPLKNEHLTY